MTRPGNGAHRQMLEYLADFQGAEILARFAEIVWGREADRPELEKAECRMTLSQNPTMYLATVSSACWRIAKRLGR